jgi:hypothetical protein
MSQSKPTEDCGKSVVETKRRRSALAAENVLTELTSEREQSGGSTLALG